MEQKVYDATAIIAALVSGEVLAGISRISLYDVGSDTNSFDIEGDALGDSLSMSQDDPEVTPIPAENGATLKELSTPAPYKVSISLARWKDEYLNFFNIVRFKQGTKAGVGFTNVGHSMEKRMVIEFQGSDTILEYPKISFVAKQTGETLRTATYKMELTGTAMPDDVAITDENGKETHSVAYFTGVAKVEG